MSRLTGTLVLAIAVAVVSSTAAAQRPYRISDKEVGKLLDRIEKAADRYSNSLDAALDRSQFDGSRKEDNINRFVEDFEDATDKLEDRFKDNKSADEDVSEVLTRAASIDNFMHRHTLDAKVQKDWRALRGHLDQLARAYGVIWEWKVITS